MNVYLLVRDQDTEFVTEYTPNEFAQIFSETQIKELSNGCVVLHKDGYRYVDMVQNARYAMNRG